jgi:acyl-CoA thioesterase FadM
VSAPLLHEKSFTVRYYETDPGRAVRPSTLLDYLQDAAAEHAGLLGVGMSQLHERGLTWVLSRLRLEAERYPGPGETVTVRTWPSTRDALTSFREFEVLDAAGAPAARATTSWVVIDLARRRPLRLAGLLPEYPLSGRRAIEDAFAPLPAGEGEALEERFTVRRSDLDVNRHVNNAVYVRWALDAAPPEIAETARLASLEASFRAEARAGDGVVVRCAPEPGAEGVLLHRLLREEDGRELTRLRTAWR